MADTRYDTPEPFKVDIPERALIDLDERLRRWRPPVAIADGGTGSTTSGGALINLGGTSVGIAVFTATDQAAAQAAIGVTGGSNDSAAIVFAVALG